MLVTLIIAILLFIHIFFLIAVLKKNYAVIDIAWGLGFILIALLSYTHSVPSLKNALLLLMVTAWGLRLALYLMARNKGLPEDSRYAALRADWGEKANIQAYFKVFVFQSFLMLVISLPVSVGMSVKNLELSFLNYLGFFIWISAFCFEAYADYYLTKFKAKPENKGTICTSGPWKICRFPNYLGEISLWYGLYLTAFSWHSSWTLIGPVILNVLILKVTGVVLLEARYLKRPEYQEYSKRVPRLIPFIHD